MHLICGYKIGDDVIGKDITTWNQSQIGENDPFKLIQLTSPIVIPESYEDITSILTLDDLGYELGLTRGTVKDEILDIFSNDGNEWNDYSKSEQEVLAKYFIVEKSKRDEVLSDEVQEQHNNFLIVLDSVFDISATDVKPGKLPSSINYKTELKDRITYTPVFIIHKSGAKAGLLDRTEYYKNFVDSNNKGDLILIVKEDYEIDNSDESLAYTARPVLSRIKSWTFYKEDGSSVLLKSKSKLYDTRRKRKIEAERRRNNVIEQLIDSVGLAGILSGVFTDEYDTYDKLTALQELHASSFVGWVSSGRGSLTTVIEDDTTTSWLDTVVADTPQTQAMCPWMIGLTFRHYIQEKLKGNIA